ncbi:hypothetical protein ACKKBG_A33600 [Auxenochlorella protothecoides x Auxenochlorella symbiontica]|uniref:Uncharacterized protein n=2 Tax=Auxenochlorella protothecoides TaxID=3075 RepID=A0A087SJ08_AUXPR|nr:hypothetical protein F751_2554 [Auxenochlorella protothecoides]KFM25712.1 hypothetical protein F751_2554 [Auxenochlorella protothecoides]RMZ57264.1 hypothetical protein APUTEX25_004098 [Auxenochlorella protothecoides]|eukprot:RMZ57264.1 hypothetical protein APUTEX25_004098 [Auxenochlorella protothecoides]
MVRFDVRPELTLHGNNETSARVNFRFNHGPNQIDVRVADRSIKNGNFTTDGVFLALRNGQGLELEYDVATKSPLVRIKSSVVVADRLVFVKYAHALKSNAAHLRLEHQVDANNIAKLDYNTVGFEGLNSKDVTLRWSHRQGDFIVEPSFNLGTESAAITARYNLDLNNRVTAHLDLGTNVGVLAWINRGVDGDLRVVARAELDKDSTQSRPTLTVSKTWTLDK